MSLPENAFLKMKMECPRCMEHQLLAIPWLKKQKINDIVQWKHWTLKIIDTFVYGEKYSAKIVGTQLKESLAKEDSLCFACQKSKLYSYKEAVLGRFGDPEDHQDTS